MKYEIKLLPGECWWGGSVANSQAMPFDENADFTWDMRELGISNQTMPLLLSSRGRYIWSEDPFAFTFHRGVIAVEGTEVVLVNAGKNLKDAYQAAMAEHFPFDGKKLPEIFFETAQYNGWMQFMYEPTQEGILEYARGILRNGFAPGVLMIDEGWQKDYGTWEFDPVKFPSPAAMTKELHEMGFRVMLWVTPYVRADGYAFEYATRFHPDHDKLFLRTTEGNVAIVAWWNGYSAILDMTKQWDQAFLHTQLHALMKNDGIDGFKFDGAPVTQYRACSIINGTPSSDASAEERNMAWNAFGRQYEFHEYKDSYKQGGKNMIQRLSDRGHSWTENGINTLIPASLIQGLLGTPFICPDMIGGGEWSTFRFQQNSQVDEELFVRAAQASALLPMMQFSLAPWQYLKPANLKLCAEAAALHRKTAPYILELVRESEISGEPIVQHLAYAFPDGGFERCSDCFMLGQRYLVAPVLQQGAVTRTLTLPEGCWKYVDGTIYHGGPVTVPAPLDTLPYFERTA